MAELATLRASDGARLHVADHGPSDAPPVVLLHSLGCDGAMWDGQVAALAGAWRVIVPDLRGHGGSDAPDGGGTTVERLGRDVLDVLDAAGVARADLCGLSLGGVVAQWVAVEAPDRVARLVLANTAARIGTAESWRDRADTVRREGLAAIADAAMARFFSERFRADRPDIVARFRAKLVGQCAGGYAACCDALRDADLTARLDRIRAPTLLVAGRADVSTPPDALAALAAAIRRSRMVLTEAAHLSNVERPGTFNASLVAHLRGAH